MTSFNDDDGFKEAVKAVFEEQAHKAYNLGWNTAVATIAQSVESMKAFGDTATSFAVFVKEFTRGDMAFSPFSATTTEEQQATEVQPKQP